MLYIFLHINFIKTYINNYQFISNTFSFRFPFVAKFFLFYGGRKKVLKQIVRLYWRVFKYNKRDNFYKIKNFAYENWGITFVLPVITGIKDFKSQQFIFKGRKY